MNLAHVARQLRGSSAYDLAVRAYRQLNRGLNSVIGRRRDNRRPTYATDVFFQSGQLAALLQRPPADVLQTLSAEIEAIANHAVAHRFDLLGSGWVEVKHGRRCRGVEGYCYSSGRQVRQDPAGQWLAGRVTAHNLAPARQVWSLVSPSYSPIDWHLDFKSGYRWPETTWFRDVHYGSLPGVDVKVPWELARMQHLPVLALAECLTPGSRGGTWVREFRDQVLDFVATNPPRYGVNWASPMDVAIRAANMLVAYDLFRAAKVEFDSAFETIVTRSMLEHGRHIAANLEWNPHFRGNHYLANLAGLLFISAYLSPNEETDGWMAFAARELGREVESQFSLDGTHFEASTCYHRLSAEMAIYSAALLLGVPAERKCAPLLPTLLERLERAAEFTVHMTKPGGRVAQIGDNDSGRFLKLVPPMVVQTVAETRSLLENLHDYNELPDDSPYWQEDHLAHHQLVAAASGLFRSIDSPKKHDHSLEYWMVRWLTRGHSVASYRTGKSEAASAGWQTGSPETLDRVEADLRGNAAADRRIIDLPAPGTSLRDGLVLYAYPDFGSYMFRSPRLFLSIRCGPIGQKGLGGHAHNDQLAIELTIDGEDWLADPGSYLYTPLPARRNQYRSMLAHFGPWLQGGEPGSLDMGLFRLGGESSTRCLHFSEAGFVGVLEGAGRATYCVVRVGHQGITAEYMCIGDRLRREATGVPFSPGYGIIRRTGSAAVNPWSVRAPQ